MIESVKKPRSSVLFSSTTSNMLKKYCGLHAGTIPTASIESVSLRKLVGIAPCPGA